MKNAYQSLEEHQAKISHLQHLCGILNWDESTMMPPGSGEMRQLSQSTMNVLVHELQTQAEIEKLLEQAEKEATNLDEWDKRNLEIIKRNFTLAKAFSADFVKRRTLVTMRAEQAWRRCRAENNWADMQPLLEEVVSITQESAQIQSELLGLEIYDALLDQYDEGLRQDLIDPLFEDLKDFLPPLLDEVLERQRSLPIEQPEGPFPQEKQKALAVELMTQIGFDFDRGRLDVSVHPFCGGHPSDVRITTRYDEQDFTSALMGVLHETGHALYEQDLPKERREQPVGRSLGMSWHESQSLFLEMQICRSREFVEYAYPLIRKHLFNGKNEKAWTLENFQGLYTRVQKSLIRVDADELSYPLHIFLRYEIEKDLIQSKMKVKDLPERWDAEMSKLFGLRTEGDYKNGVLQDIHWPLGAFGYFPSYSLGAMIAAQLFATLNVQKSKTLDLIRQGQFQEIRDWLRIEAHEPASLLTSWQLLRKVTGTPLNTDAFKTHLRKRYLPN